MDVAIVQSVYPFFPFSLVMVTAVAPQVDSEAISVVRSSLFIHLFSTPSHSPTMHVAVFRLLWESPRRPKHGPVCALHPNSQV